MTEHSTGCLLCGTDLVYSNEAAVATCALCGIESHSTASCGSGHFICDACHGATAMDVIEQVCVASASTDPVRLCTELMRSPAIHMHGPEHHFLVPAVLLSAYDNLHGQQELKTRHIADAKQRASKVPGGVCGTHGNCGAGVGTGIFWSIITGATPLSRQPWTQSNVMTARALLTIAEHGGPRCCKRDSYLAIQEAMRQVTAIDGTAWSIEQPACEHALRNKQCLKAECPFFASSTG